VTAVLPHALVHALRLPASKHQALTGPILLGVGAGLLTRAVLLGVDERPFPTRPHGRINYLFLGFVAAALGALAPAALLTADYTAGVFLGIGLGQFHTVREIERNMLLGLEDSELVPRGRAYIEGMAMTLETRNYLAMVAAMAATTLGLLWGLLPGMAAGAVAAAALAAAAGLGRTVGTVAEVVEAPVAREGDALTVGGTAVWRQAPPEAAEHAVGLLVRPRDLAARLTLAQPGQRQAILHDLAVRLGVRWLAGPPGAPEQRLAPRAAVDPHHGHLALLAFPEVRLPGRAAAVVRETPLLETLSHRLEGLPPDGGQPRP
jgi:hypothetical protein